MSEQPRSKKEAMLQRIRDLDARLKEQAEASLYSFVKQAWPIVETQRPFKENWHIGAICEHLQAVARGEIKNLGINVPPSTGKSTTVAVMFPSWVWAHPHVRARSDTSPRPRLLAARLGPSQRFMCAAYDQTQSTRDNMRTRDLVQSEWYQERWPVELREDQNLKTKFGTTIGGWRMGISVGAPRMGEHPNYKIIDDPHNPKKQLLSEKEIEQACQWYDYSFKVRGQMLDASTVLVMQRLHENDLCGHLRATEDANWEWLILPMRWEPKRMVQLSTGWVDPREGHVGALLWPSEWTDEKCDETYKPGSWGDAGQFQQRPAPAGGLMFKRQWFTIIHERPTDIVKTIRSWDVAGTEQGTGPRTAGVKMSLTSSGKFIIENVRKGRWSERDVDATIRQQAELDGIDVSIYEEQEPGSAGKAVVAARRRLLAGFSYRALPPVSDKVTRARPLRSQAEGGNVYLLVTFQDAVGAVHETGISPVPDWVEEFLAEIEMFPAGTLKDQVDAASQALNILAGVSGRDEIDFISGSTPVEMTEAEAREAERLRVERAEREVSDAIKNDGVYWPDHDAGHRSRFR